MASSPLTTTYTSPTSTQTWSNDLPALPADPKTQTVQQKTASLDALRSAIEQTQSDVNVLLTQKMEGEKSAEAGGSKSKSREEKAEEMYGEEDLSI